MVCVTLHFPTPECHLQGVYEYKVSQVQHSTSGIIHPKILIFQHSISDS